MKKLIIEIDDQTYRAVQLHPGCFNFANAILNGKPLQTELEELEAKMKPFTKDRINPHCYDVGFVNGALECLWVLQERIKELNNEV